MKKLLSVLFTILMLVFISGTGVLATSDVVTIKGLRDLHDSSLDDPSNDDEIKLCYETMSEKYSNSTDDTVYYDSAELLKSIYYYTRYPEVPNFGMNLGVSTYDMFLYEDSAIYYYIPTSSDWADEYELLLMSCGFSYVGYTDLESGGLMLIYNKPGCGYSVGFGVDYEYMNGSPITFVFIQEIGSLPETYYYSEFPEVPDFGRNLDISLYDSYFEGNIGMYYYIPDSSDWAEQYDYLLMSCGFSYMYSADLDSGGLMLIYNKSGYIVGFGVDFINEMEYVAFVVVQKEDFSSTKTYTISYNANGGYNAPEEQVKEHNERIRLSTEKPERDGYEFVGWSTDANATEPEYKSGASYNENSDLTLYAVWKKIIIEVKKITLNKTKLTMVVGDSEYLNSTVSPYNATYQQVTWASSNTSVATVDENGVVTALKAGTAKITAKTENGKKATCTITVGAPADTVTFSSLKTTSLAVGKTLTLSAKASCADKTKPVSTDVVYEIVDGEGCATIDSKGKLKGIATGEVTVRATAVAGTEDAYDEIVINVCIPATKVTLNMTKASMIVGGEDLYLEATRTPVNNTDTLTWSVDKSDIATVDEYGVVTAHKAGKVKVTAKAGSGKSATCTITVGEPATKVEFTSLKSTSLAVGKTLTLKAKASRDDKIKPVSTGVVYEIVDGEEYATIDSKGKLKGIAAGKVTVRATAETGTETAYADIFINVCVPITKIKFAQSKLTINVGDMVDIQTPTFTPYNHTDTVEFYSSNENAAVVEDGMIVAVAKGTAKIYAKSGSGKSAYYTVKVVP